MSSTASSSISSRVATGGHRCPRMCSLRFSPLPIPNWNRPSVSCWVVAAAWARMAGWMRTVGQVTPVVMRWRVVAAMAPSTLQTKGLSP